MAKIDKDGGVASAAAIARRPNLASNGSFEHREPFARVASDWVAQERAGATYALERSGPDGRRCQRIELQGTVDPISGFAAVRQPIPGISPAWTYTVSVEYRAAFAATPQSERTVGTVTYCLEANIISGSRGPTPWKPIEGGTFVDWGWPTVDEWTRRSFDVRPHPSTQGLLLEFRLSVEGTLWVSSARLVRSAKAER